MNKIWTAHFQGTPFSVYQFKMFEDSFGYLIESGGRGVAIDISDGDELLQLLKDHHIALDTFLITHHHRDHIKGARLIKEKTGCQLIGPKQETLDFLDQDVVDGEEFAVGPFAFEVMATPGHSQDHVSYFFRDCSCLFCGDTLLLSGCGRIFDSTAEHLYKSLQMIKQLPAKTLIFCGHDHTEKNIKFAQLKEPNNEQLSMAGYVSFRSLEEECLLNPFLRALDLDKFKKLREEKDLYDAKLN